MVRSHRGSQMAWYHVSRETRNSSCITAAVVDSARMLTGPAVAEPRLVLADMGSALLLGALSKSLSSAPISSTSTWLGPHSRAWSVLTPSWFLRASLTVLAGR